jgi:hypothetical protein
MALPYNTGGMGPLMQLADSMASTGMRIGGTSELQVGEGKQEMPVGTTMALIEQATKVLDAVHKRLHASQAIEFSLLMKCFKEHPEAFWQRQGPSKTKWDEETFLRALDDCDLVPQADPNTSSHGQRVMKVMALKQLQQQSPDIYDAMSVDRAALITLGWTNPDQFLKRPGNDQPPPEIIKGMEELKIEHQKADAQTLDAQTRAKEADARIAQGGLAPPQQQQQAPDGAKMLSAQAKIVDVQNKARMVDLQHQQMMVEDQNRDLDRVSREKVELLSLAKDVASHPDGLDEAESVIHRHDGK